LYLFAVLKHLRIELDFSHASPDFVAAEIPLSIEATIASHAHDRRSSAIASCAGLVPAGAARSTRSDRTAVRYSPGAIQTDRGNLHAAGARKRIETERA